MMLWLLRPIEPRPNLWKPWYDKSFGFVVRASTEEEARHIAQANGGDEIGPTFFTDGTQSEGPRAWLDAQYSSCVPLINDGKPALIIRDFWAA